MAYRCCERGDVFDCALLVESALTPVEDRNKRELVIGKRRREVAGRESEVAPSRRRHWDDDMV